MRPQRENTHGAVTLQEKPPSCTVIVNIMAAIEDTVSHYVLN